MKATLSDTKAAPWETDDAKHKVSGYRPHWKIRLTGPGGSYTFDYFDSIANGEKGAPEPSAYSILSCLPWSDPGTFADFCWVYGYDEDSRKAEKTYRAIKAQAANLARIFPSEADREGMAAVR